MPAMGDSVAEGTVLEWHKSEGDTVAADETIVEISTDKVDAEVPAPIAGTVVKIVAAEGDTVAVGAVLAEIAPGNGSGAGRGNGGGRRQRRAGRTSPPPPADATPTAARDADAGAQPTEAEAEQIVEIVTPTGGESVTEGTILEWSVKVGDEVKDGDTVVEISTDKVDMELPAPASGTITEILAAEGDTVNVGQVIGRMSVHAGGRRGGSAPKPAATPAGNGARRAGPTARRHRRRRQRVPDRPARRRGRGRRPRPGDRLRPRRPDHEGRRAGRRHGARQRQRRATRSRRVDADQGLGRGARALHGREPLDPDRHLVPDAHGHDPGRPPQAAEGRRPEGLVHPSDRVRDRARGDRRDAGHGPPLRRGRRQAPPRRRRGGQPRPGRRRRAQGRRPHADGAGDPRRGPHELLATSSTRTTRSSRRRGRTR